MVHRYPTLDTKPTATTMAGAQPAKPHRLTCSSAAVRRVMMLLVSRPAIWLTVDGRRWACVDCTWGWEAQGNAWVHPVRTVRGRATMQEIAVLCCVPRNGTSAKDVLEHRCRVGWDLEWQTKRRRSQPASEPWHKKRWEEMGWCVAAVQGG